MIPPALPSQPAADPSRDARLRDAAQRLEAGFLKEMLSAAGLGHAPSSFGGEEGEDQFSSFLLDEQALRLARSGGIGLAESIYESLKARDAG
ncbi:flagellar protein FlgJ, putative [Rubellimicrobium mesophilum DSM 19309]|uniref:Flagellar protein FlgJ, putative n=1 Tax=Rubellimicrobium mesophilum DSM 19309 TaxID=442562 RepID=A0A017HHQ7_9RHOB|nr:rod-binding protein [Rubellimicrobium mesophilum]EYD73886.1 flagellar protein FlgJ, putative [Rubellimicrobium mesophilum DSM 19309]